MRDFSSYRAAAAFARLRAQESQQSAKLERRGERWLVRSADEIAADGEAARRVETLAIGRRLIKAEIEETRIWLAACGKPRIRS